MTVLLYSVYMGIGKDLGLEIAELAARLDAATHRLLTCIRQFDEQSGWAEQGAVSCAHWLSWRIGLDLATAREKVRVAREEWSSTPSDRPNLNRLRENVDRPRAMDHLCPGLADDPR